MDFKFEVSVSVERTQGKFASRDEIEEALQSELEGADPGSVEGSEGGEYEVQDWSVEAIDIKPAKGKAKAKNPLREYPELLALASAWYHMNQNQEDLTIERFEHAMEAAFQLITDD